MRTNLSGIIRNYKVTLSRHQTNLILFATTVESIVDRLFSILIDMNHICEELNLQAAKNSTVEKESIREGIVYVTTTLTRIVPPVTKSKCKKIIADCRAGQYLAFDESLLELATISDNANLMTAQNVFTKKLNLNEWCKIWVGLFESIHAFATVLFKTTGNYTDAHIFNLKILEFADQYKQLMTLANGSDTTHHVHLPPIDIPETERDDTDNTKKVTNSFFNRDNGLWSGICDIDPEYIVDED
jgi:putative sterol carrier protein